MDARDGEQIAAVLESAAVLVVRHLIYGQSLTSALVLAQLDDGGPARISELAAANGVSQPSMTELVGRLQREDLVARFADPQDRRATMVDITTSGRTQRLQLQRSLHGRVNELLQALPAEDQATLSLAMRVASPLINLLKHSSPRTTRLPSETAHRRRTEPRHEHKLAMDRIVVGVDGSPASTAGAVWAAGEAAMRDIELTIVHVLSAPTEACTRMEWPTTPLPSELTNAVVAQGVDVVDQTLDAVAKGIGRQPPRITSQLCFGPVVPTLWEFTQQGAQMIALGRHSRGNALRAGLSSID